MWLLMAIISINHIYKVWDELVFSTKLLGWIGWITFCLTILYLVRNFYKNAFIIFCVFFILGYASGPYFEPISDPVMHLGRTHEMYCDNTSNFLPKKNQGFWHYSMSSILLCSKEQNRKPESVIYRIDITHGLYWGFLMVGLFILSKSTGLPDRWAIFASLTAFLFFGTNKFSYFSYYSLAPTFTNILIYWLWTAMFFFKNDQKNIIIGTSMALASLPILWINHMQEAAFMVFILFIWLTWNLIEYIWNLVKKNQIDTIFGSTIHERYILNHNYYKIILMITGFVSLFLLPQFKFIQDLISQSFTLNFWQQNQKIVIHWKDFHLMGKIWDFRINDTLGFVGFLPMMLAPLFLWPIFKPVKKVKQYRIFVLGILPLIGFCVPLFNFIWLSNTSESVYWRLCYSSMFWVTIAYFLYRFEGVASLYWEKSRQINHFKFFKKKKDVRSFKSHYFTGCLITLIVLSGIRSSPIYGKTDFILLDSRPWWISWKPMIESAMKRSFNKPVLTDVVTGNVLHGIFGIPIAKDYKVIRYGKKSNEKRINIKDADSRKINKSFQCIVNLAGFKPSWVPDETQHWYRNLADTSYQYFFNDKTGDGLVQFLEENHLKNCSVLTANGDFYPNYVGGSKSHRR